MKLPSHDWEADNSQKLLFNMKSGVTAQLQKSKIFQHDRCWSYPLEVSNFAPHFGAESEPVLTRTLSADEWGVRTRLGSAREEWVKIVIDLKIIWNRFGLICYTRQTIAYSKCWFSSSILHDVFLVNQIEDNEWTDALLSVSPDRYSRVINWSRWEY